MGWRLMVSRVASMPIYAAQCGKHDHFAAHAVRARDALITTVLNIAAVAHGYSFE